MLDGIHDFPFLFAWTFLQKSNDFDEFSIFQILVQSSMQNPFTSSNKLTVSKQYERIKSRQRSYSQSSFDSFNSDRSFSKSILEPPWQGYKYHRQTNKFGAEYMGKQWQKDLEYRTAKVLGLDQLRYKPQYLQGQTQQHNSRCSQQYIQSISSPKIIVKSVSKNQLSQKKSSKKTLTNSAKSIQSFQSGRIPGMQKSQNNIIGSLPYNTIQPCEESEDYESQTYLKTLINVDGAVSGINENYTSINDIGSQKILKLHSLSNKRRTSCFYEEAQIVKRQTTSSIRSQSGRNSGLSCCVKTLTSQSNSQQRIQPIEQYYFRTKQAPTVKKKRNPQYWDAINQSITSSSNVDESRSCENSIPSSIFVRDKIFFLAKTNIKY